ncbi:MAG: penicillin-binding transpeptidase domain-containing protein [Roseburia sp.]
MKIQKTRTLNSTRGNIYDRNGKLLAYNELAYSVVIEDNGVYDTTKDRNDSMNAELYEIIQTLDKNGDEIVNDFQITLEKDGSYSFNVSGSAKKRFLADVYDHTSTDDLKYNKSLGYNEAEATAAQVMEYLCRSSKEKGYDLSEDDYSREDLYRIVVLRYAISLNSYQKYIVTTIAQNVSDATVAYITENKGHLQGANIAEDTIRKYVDAEYFSHFIGYTGKISQDEYDVLKEEDDSYTLNDVIGKSGIEQYMDSTLRGTKGSETVYVDSLGRVILTTDRVEPSAGNNVYLSIDMDLQKAIYDLLEQKIAGILYSKIVNTKSTDSSYSSSSDIVIPIDDVYFALIDNNVLSLDDFAQEDASSTEQEIYRAFLNKQSSVLSWVEQELSASSPTAMEDLEREQYTYMSYMVSMLEDKGILLSDSIDTSDSVYQDFKNDKISAKEYLKYAISQNWIDITAFTMSDKYSDSDEIYEVLCDYILQEITDDNGFSKKIYQYMIQNNQITGTQLCLALFDQKVLSYDDDAISNLSSGNISAYSFIKEKIKNLEITPAQLALDPCSGSCVIADVNTGELLACVTYPGYDTNRLANNMDVEYYNQLYNDQSVPFYNYATQQRTAPGSTFKMVTAAAALTEGVITPTTEIEDKGQFEEVENGPKCWIYPSNHGFINVSEALRDSCNYFFYKVGYDMSMDNGVYNEELGVNTINKYSSLFGLDEKTGIEISESAPKQTTEYPITSAIGQSNNSFTTIQLSRYVTAVANSGTVYNYTLLSKVTDPDGNVLESYSPTVKNQITTISQSSWDAIHSGMKMVVETHEQFDDLGIESAGKTGTAQQVKSRPNHALYVGYAPYDDPEISIACRIAYGYSSSNTAELAASVYKYYFDLEDKEILLDHQADAGSSDTNSFND